MVVPVLLVLFSLMFFLGTNVRRMETTTGVTRYEAHRQAVGARGPGANRTRDDNWLTNTREVFFGSTAPLNEFAITAEDTLPEGDAVTDAWAAELEQLDQGRTLANEQLQEYLDRFPEARQVRVRVSQDNRVPLWDEVFGNRALQHQSAWVGSQWRFADLVGQAPNSALGWYLESRLSNADPNRDTFEVSDLAAASYDTHFPEFSDDLEQLSTSNNIFSRSVESWLRATPRYRGPNLWENTFVTE